MAVATVVLGDPRGPPPKNEPRIKGKGKGKEEGEFLRVIDLVIRVV